jgi:RNA polymerase sigma-70 factor (ECF subfamily)
MDETDLTRCFEAHAAALALYARQWLDRGQAEDAVQEVFVRLILQRTPPANAKAWLYRAVRNEAISQWRSSRSRELRERNSATAGAWFDPQGSTKEDIEALTEAMARLSRIEREILVLRIWGELTFQEISELIDSPTSTVFLHYKTALASLKNRMGMPCEKKTN